MSSYLTLVNLDGTSFWIPTAWRDITEFNLGHQIELLRYRRKIRGSRALVISFMLLVALQEFGRSY